MPVVRRSAVIEASVDVVWAVLRDFNSHARWHPAIAESAIEGLLAPDSVGCVRRFVLTDGSVLREQLLYLSDREHALRYCILDSPIPLLGYVATLRLRPVTATGAAFCIWESRFGAPPGQEASLAALVGETIYQAGFDGLRRYLRGTPALTAVPHGEPHAMVMAAHGGPEVMQWRPWPVRHPGPGEVRIRHAAIGVNFIDIHTRTGQLHLLDPPGVPGLEAAGVVLATGPGVTHLQPGQRVGYACTPPGAYATERTMSAELVLPLPDDLDDVQAAAALLKGMTASLLLHDVHPLRAGELVLVQPAAGGVGLLLCQWAAALGGVVIGVVGSPEKAAAARANGCALVVVAAEAGSDLATQVRRFANGKGVDVAFDGIGGARSLAALAALGEGSHLVSFGQAGGPVPALEPAMLARRSARLSRPDFSHYTNTRTRAEGVAGRLFAAVRGGVVRIPPPRRMALREAAAAHRALETRASIGATVLIP